MKNKILFLLILSIAVVAVYGAGSRAPGSSGAAASRDLSLCMSQIRYGYSVDDKLMRSWVEPIEKATNTKIEIKALPHNDFFTLLNVQMASGDYPDIIRPQQSWNYVTQFAIRGYLQPLTRFINNDPRFAQLKGLDLAMYTYNKDIYGIPTEKGNVKNIWFRKDSIDKYRLNIKDSMTTAEFVTELRKINKSEAIPFTFPRFIVNFQIFYNFFGAYAGILPDKNGNYYDGFQTNEMKEALRWVKSLYDEGLMDSQFITNENSHMREKFASGRAASDIDYTQRYSYYVQTANDVGAPTDFVPVYTLVGPRGNSGNLNESGNEAMCLSVRNPNVEASMDIINWLFFTQEGRIHDAIGVEGVHYNITNRLLVPTQAAASTGYSIEHQRFSNSWAEVPFSRLGFSFQGLSDDTVNTMLKYVAIALEPRYKGPLIRIPMGMSPIYDENVATYNANLDEMATKIVLGTQTVDAAYADYARFWNSIRGDEMLRQINAAMKK